MIKHKTFSASAVGMQARTSSGRIIDDLGRKITDWANAQAQEGVGPVEIQHVAMSQSRYSAHALVLYREPESDGSGG